MLDIDGQGLGDTDGVRQLDEGTTGEAGGDQRLGDPPTDVRSGTVDLAVVLAGEGTTTVGAPATVGIDNDLPAGETSVTLGTANDEAARRLDLRGCQYGDGVTSSQTLGSNVRGRRSSRRACWRG